jgi:glucose-1-phosphate thymidylyltransferase
MKGVILAGGTGSRMFPITKGISKQLVPVFDKPMIYYPLSTLVEGGVREILIITTPEDQAQFQRLLGDGSPWGIDLKYEVQVRPEGIAQSLLIAQKFIQGDQVALVLGDNIFHGAQFTDVFAQARGVPGAHILGYRVSDPSRYGVLAFGADGEVIRIEEKPLVPPSGFAVPGLYIYDADVVRIAGGLEKSERGEFEISAVNEQYLRAGKLSVHLIDRGAAWLDTGTFESMIQAAEYVRVIEQRQGTKIGCVEEAAWRAGYITDDQLLSAAVELLASGYGAYLRSLVEHKRRAAAE